MLLSIKDIKLASDTFIRNENLFPDFMGWQQGYGAFTHSFAAKDKLKVKLKSSGLLVCCHANPGCHPGLLMVEALRAFSYRSIKLKL